MIRQLSPPPRRSRVLRVKTKKLKPQPEAKSPTEKHSPDTLCRGVAGLLTLTRGASVVSCSPQSTETIVAHELAPEGVSPDQVSRQDLARPNTQEVKVEGKIKSLYSALRSVGFTNSEIAQHGLVEQVVQLNGLQSPSKIQLGQKLIVPRKTRQANPALRREEQPAGARPTLKAPATQLSFGRKLQAHQKTSIQKVAVDLSAMGFQVKADDVANFMAVETAGTFSTTIRSSGGAIGLAQFTNIAIKDMNQRRPANQQLSKTKLARMDFSQQSEVVTEYLATALERGGMRGCRVSDADLYAAVFCPAAIGKSPNTTLYRSGTSAYQRNKSLDHDGNGCITKAEMTARLSSWALRGEGERG